MTPEQIASALIDNAGKTGNLGGYRAVDPEFLRKAIASEIRSAYGRGIQDATDAMRKQLAS